MRRVALVVLSALATTPARAQSAWQDYAPAFQAMPCADGWAGCRVDGQVVQPGLIADSAGMPTPAHMRIGWFDLEPTRSFSPMPALSDYPTDGRAYRAPEPDDAVAVVELATPRPRPTAPPEPIPAPEQVAPTPAPEPIPAPPPGISCEMTELVGLEIEAMVGTLAPERVAACEHTLATAPRMTDRNKVSRLLLANDFARGDQARWERRMRHHLTEIDQSDPDLCFRYARQLASRGAATAPETIRWAEAALENRSAWVGDLHTSRVDALYRIRAQAAYALWQASELAHAAAPGTAEADRIGDQRATAKVMAREWLEYARSANRDATRALELCTSAAGTGEYCEN